MNRYKKEQIKKYKEIRRGLTPDQIEALDKKEEKERRIHEVARSLHAELFPEEYDFMFDDNWDVKLRDKGINPMSAEYIEKVKRKRELLGVSMLSENGMAKSNDTMQICIEKAKNMIDETQ